MTCLTRWCKQDKELNSVQMWICTCKFNACDSCYTIWVMRAICPEELRLFHFFSSMPFAQFWVTAKLHGVSLWKWPAENTSVKKQRSESSFSMYRLWSILYLATVQVPAWTNKTTISKYTKTLPERWLQEHRRVFRQLGVKTCLEVNICAVFIQTVWFFWHRSLLISCFVIMLQKPIWWSDAAATVTYKANPKSFLTPTLDSIQSRRRRRPGLRLFVCQQRRFASSASFV